MKLSIVIPCFNEAKSIPFLVDQIKECISSKNDVEVILVDNGSKDETPQVINAILANPFNDFIKSIRIETNIGYGHGIITGLNSCTGDIIAWTHADLQTDMYDVFTGFTIFSLHDDPQKIFIKGFRIKRKIVEKILTLGMSLIVTLVIGIKLSEINAQPKIFHKSFLKNLNHCPVDFSFDLYVLYVAKINGFTFIEFPVKFNRRLHGTPKGGGSNLKTKIKIIKRTIGFIFRLRKEVKLIKK